jgi:hypothetical protein
MGLLLLFGVASETVCKTFVSQTGSNRSDRFGSNFRCPVGYLLRQSFRYDIGIRQQPYPELT